MNSLKRSLDEMESEDSLSFALEALGSLKIENPKRKIPRYKHQQYKPVCNECNRETDESESSKCTCGNIVCNDCEKNSCQSCTLCSDCCQEKSCTSCAKDICSRRDDMQTCDSCDNVYCEDCSYTWVQFGTIIICNSCQDAEDYFYNNED